MPSDYDSLTDPAELWDRPETFPTETLSEENQ